MVNILLVKTMSGVTAGPGAKPVPIAYGLSYGQILFIGILGTLLFLGFSGMLAQVLLYLLKGRKQALSVLPSLILGPLLIMKMLYNPTIVGNILVFLVLLISLNFATRLTKSAFISIFIVIILLDIYLVWCTSVTASALPSSRAEVADELDAGWYIAMFRSNFMQHFPFPVGFRFADHLLGNGDIFFMGVTVMYAMRVWSMRAAVTAGVLMTLPLLLLPFAHLVLKTPPMAWPYTIFIAPVALCIAIFAPKNLKRNQ